MKWPKISVIIPCYNYEQYVCDTVYSCLIQDYSGEFEIIVVDDCSTDSSYSKLRRNFNQEIGGDKLKILKMQRNVGYSAAKNQGIIKSSGELIVTLDADDMLSERSLETRAWYMNKHPEADMVHCAAYTIKGGGGYEYWNKRVYKLEKWLNFNRKKIHAQTTMIRRRTHVKYGLYYEPLRSRSDNEMWFRLRLCGCDIHKLDIPVAFYRKHGLSMVQYRKKNPIYNNDVTRILEERKQEISEIGITRDNTRFLKK